MSQKSRTRLRAVLVSIVLLIGSIPSRGEFIQPVAVLASNGEATQETLISGQGFAEPGIGSPESIHSRSTGDAWSAIGSIKADVTLDLGMKVGLTKIYIWNYNVAGNTDIGMKDVEVLVSADTDMATAKFLGIANLSLAQGGEAAQVFEVIGTNVRLVKLHGLSNWGQGYTVGLAEVRFESDVISGNMPSVTVSTPHEGDVIPFGTDIQVNALISDKEGNSNLQKVQLYDGTRLLLEKTTVLSILSYIDKKPAKGEHAYRVVATDKTAKVTWYTVNLEVRELVADRIEQVDDTVNIGPDLGQIQYTGTWNLAQGNDSDPRFNHNDHYADSRGAFFEVRFKAVKIDLYATVASHHGNAIATIDGGTEYKVSYYASQRKEQALVWSSPILQNHEHVLKIRVVGDGVVTADRFDLQVSDKPEVTIAGIKKVTPSLRDLILEMEDAANSIVDPTSLKLSIDGAPVTAEILRNPPITTLTYSPASPFAPGSTHTLKLAAKDTQGAEVGGDSSFTLPSPFFPLTGLGEPRSADGYWSLRQIWGAGRADSIRTAVDIAVNATRPGFTGTIEDDLVPVINHALSSGGGAGGLFPGDEPLPAEQNGLPTEDFVLVGHARVIIPSDGDWTLGVHSDDGFALRVVGAPFFSVNGNGVLDEVFPEYMVHQSGTADSNTRGVLSGIAAGQYEIEFIGWQRVGRAFFEIYAAPGAFDVDSASDAWALIGSPEGFQIVSGTPLSLGTVTKTIDQVTIDFVSPNPDGTYTLLESLDLQSWTSVPAAVFAKTGGNGVRVTLNGVTGGKRFYRVALPN